MYYVQYCTKAQYHSLFWLPLGFTANFLTGWDKIMGAGSGSQCLPVGLVITPSICSLGAANVAVDSVLESCSQGKRKYSLSGHG